MIMARIRTAKRQLFNREGREENPRRSLRKAKTLPLRALRKAARTALLACYPDYSGFIKLPPSNRRSPDPDIEV